MRKSQIRVLLVSNDEYDHVIIQGLLEEVTTGAYLLTGAPTYAAARKALKRGRFDVCLLDRHLGKHDGLELLRDAVARGCRIPVVMLTGRGDRDADLLAIEAGAADYLDKHQLTGAMLERSIRYAIERKRLMLALQESDERYAVATRATTDGLWDWDLVTRQISFSERWAAILGFEPQEITNSPDEWLGRAHPEDVQKLQNSLNEHLLGTTPQFECEHRLRHKDQSYRWVKSRGLAVRNRKGLAVRVAGSLTDVTSQKDLTDRLIHDTLHDALTKLPNRTLFIDRMSQMIKRRIRHHDPPFAVLFLDVDGFRYINSRVGHLEADQCLIEMGRRLESCVRPTDTVSRFGGDEFAILVSDINGDKEAEALADRIQKSVSAPMRIADHEITPSASIGIALSPASGDTADVLLQKADAAMYIAKDRGRGHFALYDGSTFVASAQWPEMASDLRRALNEGALQLHYQPIVSFTTYEIIGFEALARWSHPKKGPVPPAKFIPVAEQAGLIAELDQWVLKESCARVASWGTKFDTHPPLAIFVNLSAQQLLRPALINDLESLLKDVSIDPECLHLEMPESEVMMQGDKTIQVLEQIAALGIQLQLDSFGLGNSSLSYLTRLPLKALKIHRSFVSRLEKDSLFVSDADDENGNGHKDAHGNKDGYGNAKVLRSLVTLAHELGLKVIAEGIETRYQLQQVSGELGCDFGQGFFIAPPVASDVAPKFLATHVSWGRERECLVHSG